MSDILTKIEAYKREEIAAAKQAHPLSEIEARAKAASPPRGFLRAIREKLAPVVGGLATAFNTTLVALVAAVGVQLLTTYVYKMEEDLLDDCTQYCNDHIVSRLKLTNW